MSTAIAMHEPIPGPAPNPTRLLAVCGHSDNPSITPIPSVSCTATLCQSFIICDPLSLKVNSALLIGVSAGLIMSGVQTASPFKCCRLPIVLSVTGGKEMAGSSRHGTSGTHSAPIAYIHTYTRGALKGLRIYIYIRPAGLHFHFYRLYCLRPPVCCSIL